MKETPKVSVIMGCYNGGSLLSATVDSVLSQRGVDFEIIIINDGSTDGTPDTLNGYARDDRRVKVVNCRRNEGLTLALIRGCAGSSGEYIARQDVGDLSLPGRLRKQADFLDANLETGLVSCSFRLVGPRGEMLRESVGQDGRSVTARLRKGDAKQLVGPHHGTVMFRRSVYETVGGYRENFYCTQDLDLWSRFAERSSLDFLPEVLYQVRFSQDGLSARFHVQQRRLRELIATAIRRRARNEPEDDLLAEATRLSRPSIRSGHSRKAISDADYFIGSCLASRRDPAAGRYLLSSLRNRPVHVKAWAKLLWFYTACGAAKS